MDHFLSGAPINRTVDDLVNFNRFHWRNSPAMQRMYYSGFVGAPVVGIAVAFVARSEPPLVIAFGVVGAMAGYSLFLIWYSRWSLRWAVRKLLAEGHSKGALGHHEIEINPDGVYERTAVNESRQSWASVERVLENDRYIFIYTQPMMAHVIPKSAFASTEEATSFLSQAQSFHGGA